MRQQLMIVMEVPPIMTPLQVQVTPRNLPHTSRTLMARNLQVSQLNSSQLFSKNVNFRLLIELT